MAESGKRVKSLPRPASKIHPIRTKKRVGEGGVFGGPRWVIDCGSSLIFRFTESLRRRLRFENCFSKRASCATESVHRGRVAEWSNAPALKFDRVVLDGNGHMWTCLANPLKQMNWRVLMWTDADRNCPNFCRWVTFAGYFSRHHARLKTSRWPASSPVCWTRMSIR